MAIKDLSLKLAAISLLADQAKRLKDELRAELLNEMNTIGADRVKAELVGFASITPKPPTEKMLAWFKRSAPSIGVSTDAAVNSKNFQILPICLDTGIRLARRY